MQHLQSAELPLLVVVLLLGAALLLDVVLLLVSMGLLPLLSSGLEPGLGH